jgi:hypothetical protein
MVFRNRQLRRVRFETELSGNQEKVGGASFRDPMRKPFG